jgi:hypothetical protein
MNFELYYKTVIRSATNELCSPRVTFNWGYHDAKDDMKNGRPLRDMDTHPDPYYTAGYLEAQQPHTHPTDSSFTWQNWTSELTRPDYETTAAAILEAMTRGQEYLFSEKRDRGTFSQSTIDSLISYFDRALPAGNAEQMRIKNATLTRFGLD